MHSDIHTSPKLAMVPEELKQTGAKQNALPSRSNAHMIANEIRPKYANVVGIHSPHPFDLLINRDIQYTQNVPPHAPITSRG